MVLEREEWCGRPIGCVEGRQGGRERLGGALYGLAAVHRRRGLRAPAGSALEAVGEELELSTVFVGME